MESMIDRILEQFPVDLLPNDQEIIETSEVKRFYSYTTELAAKTGSKAKIGCFTGNAGIGKTTAARYSILNRPILSFTGLPDFLYWELPPKTTQRVFLLAVLQFFNIEPEERHSSLWAKKVKEIIHANHIRLIILDESNRVTDEILEIIRYLISIVGISILLLGTNQTIMTIRKNQQFRSPVWQPRKMKPLSESEMIKSFLPKVKVPKWDFDPNNIADAKMGSQLWKRVSPDLRILTTLLGDASRIASFDKQSNRISAANVDQAIKLNIEGVDSNPSANEPETKKFSPELSPEDLSELRQSAKQK